MQKNKLISNDTPSVVDFINNFKIKNVFFFKDEYNKIENNLNKSIKSKKSIIL